MKTKPLQESIRRILSEETQIPSVIRRRISSDDIEEAFDYALERMGGSMNNPNSIIYKEKGTTLGTFAKFVIDEMVTYIEQDYFNDNNRIYFSDTEEDEETYHEKIRKPLLRHYGKRIKEKYNEVMSSNNEEIIQEHIKKVLREEVGLIDRLRKLFPKKELTTEEKRMDLIVRYLIPMFKLQSHKNTNSEGHKTISIISFNSDGNSTVMKYFPEYKRLEYTRGFAEKIHKMFPHKDLLDLNSEMIGQLFTKLYKKKVDRVERYRYLS